MMFTVVGLNIWNDKENWPVRRDYICRVLGELCPDVVCLQEVLQNKEFPNQAKTIADVLGCDFYFASADPEDDPKRFGNAILSRHIIVSKDWKILLVKTLS